MVLEPMMALQMVRRWEHLETRSVSLWVMLLEHGKVTQMVMQSGRQLAMTWGFRLGTRLATRWEWPLELPKATRLARLSGQQLVQMWALTTATQWEML
jgi:hypothetical protein